MQFHRITLHWSCFPILFDNLPKFHHNHCVWRPDLQRATDAAKRRFYSATARLLEPFLHHRPSDERCLDESFSGVAAIIREQAQRHLPAVRQGKRKTCPATRAVMRKCRALQHMIMQIERVKQGVICIASTTFRSAVSNLKRRGIAPAGCELQWEEFNSICRGTAKLD